MWLLSFPQMQAEASKSAVCETLKPSKTYYYNLDKKGKKEKIKYTLKKSDSKSSSAYDYTAIVSINGKQVYKKTLKGFYDIPFLIMVTDTNANDNQMELMIMESKGGFNDVWYSDIDNLYYYQYKNGKAVRKQNLASLYRKNIKSDSPENMLETQIHGMKAKSYLTVSGKGELYARICFYHSNFNFIHLKGKLKLKNGKFKFLAKELNILDTKTADNLYLALKDTNVYTKPGGNKKAYIIKAGEYIDPYAIHLTSKGKIYLKVRNSKGKTGYIDPSKVSIQLRGTHHA